VKLSSLHKATARQIMENIDAGVHEKLGFLQLMIARQGKDPSPIISRIRGMIDPSYAKSEGFKSTFKNWVQTAQPNDTKDGRAYGRKIKVTVLESAIRGLITEGFFSDLGKVVLAKLKSVIDDEPHEHEMISNALDAYPQLAWIPRYASKAQAPLMDDEAFWQKVNQTTNGLGEKIKALLMATYKRLEEARQTNPQATILSECVITEARISGVMQSLGLEAPEIQSIMGDYGIRDEDYDLSRLKELYEKGAGAVKAGVDAVKGAPGALAQKAGEVASNVKSSVKSSADVQRVAKANADIADQVILHAAFMLKSAEAMKQGAETPQQAVQQASQELEYGDYEEITPGVEKPQAKPENVVSKKDFAPQA
jgi:hypothetical protein